MPIGTVDITGTPSINGTRRPETGGLNITAPEVGANKIGRVLLGNGGVSRKGQAAGVRDIGRVFLLMLGMVLRPGKARPAFLIAITEWMPSGTVDITGTLSMIGTRRPETGGMNITAPEVGANKIGRVLPLENGGVGQESQASGVRKTGRVFLLVLGMVLCPGKARPYYANWTAEICRWNSMYLRESAHSTTV